MFPLIREFDRTTAVFPLFSQCKRTDVPYWENQRVSAEILRDQLKDLSKKIRATLQPTFVIHRIGQDL